MGNHLGPGLYETNTHFNKTADSVNTQSWSAEKAVVERSDVCAVPAASVVGEAMMAYVIAGSR